MAGAVAQFPFGNVLEALEYGPATEGDSIAQKWLEKHNRNFGYFINGQWSQPVDQDNAISKRPSTGETLAHTLEATAEDIHAAALAAKEEYERWSALSPHSRAKVLYSITRNIQKHQSLLALVEALDSGRPTKETRGVVVPAVIRCFYHYAGWAQLLAEEMPGWTSVGVTAVFPSGTSPLLQLAERVAPALSAGNTVIVMPSSHTRLSALLLADICAQAGVPPGVFNVVTGSTPGLLASDPCVDVVTLAGSASEGLSMRQLLAGSGKKLSLELNGHCPVLVFEEADLDSAVEGIIDAAFSNSGQSTYSASRFLIQQPVFDQLISKLKARMSKLTVGNNMDKNMDQGPLSDPGVILRLSQLLQEARGQGAEVFQASSVQDGVHDCFPPTLVTGAEASSQIFVEELCGPVLVAVPFRTEKEGITIANHGLGCAAASVWTENISVALEAASLLQAATVWVNSHGLLDAACSSGGHRACGFGRQGGNQGLYGFMRPRWQPVLRTTNNEVDLDKFGASSSSDLLPGEALSGGGDGDTRIDKTYKLFYGGGQKRPDSGASLPVKGFNDALIGYVPDGGKKDIRNAVEAAIKAAPGWGKKDGHGKSQILYYMAENLQARRSEFTSLLALGRDASEAALAEQEVDLAVQRLFHWAAYCDKHGGTVQESSFYGHTYSVNHPLGVIGVICPDSHPFLAFISLIAPAIARGNAVVAVPSSCFPVAALAFHQIAETSDVPAGVINIITGDRDVLTRTLAQHQDVGALWYFGPREAGSTFVEAAAAGGSMKRTWVNYGLDRDWSSSQQGQGEEFLVEATTSKSIWLPMGSIFAN